MKKFEAGFIGAGNMGGALATAAAKQVTGELVAVACSSPAHSAAAAERLGCRAAAPEEILGGSKFVFLGVKPQMLQALLAELNRQKDKKGRPYHFALTTWDEEGIVLPPDAA